MSRLSRVVFPALIGLALVAGPAAAPAAAGVLDYGAIANCRYNVTEGGTYGWTEALLKKIAISPPTIAKQTGTKSVGWRFVVERSLNGDVTPWRVIYRSPLQRAGSSAGLSIMRVYIHVPSENDLPNAQSFVWYRVILKMFRYTADGSVQTKVVHVMNDMHVNVDGDVLVDSYCPGLALQFFDGP